MSSPDSQKITFEGTSRTDKMKRKRLLAEEKKYELEQSVAKAYMVVYEALEMLHSDQNTLANIRAENDKFVSGLITNKLLDSGDITIQTEVEIKVEIYNSWMKDIESYLPYAKSMDEPAVVMDKMRLAHSQLFFETVNKRKVFDQVDTSNALSVLEHDIMSDVKAPQKVERVEGEAILSVQEDDIITDLENFPKWAKKKKPTTDAIMAFFPIIEWVKNYKKEYLQADISVGLSSGTMIIPQAMAYAFLAGMPPIYGLYCAFVPTIMYAIFGTSRHLAVGPLAICSILVGASIRSLNPQTTDDYVGLASTLALLVGINFLLMSILRLGFLISFLSRPVLSGFTSAAAIIIITSQLHYFFGVKVPSTDIYAWAYIYHTCQQLGHTVVWEPLMGIFCLSMLYVMKTYVKKIPFTNVPIPSPLILVALGLIVSYAADLQQYKIAIVGSIPSGLPKPNFFSRFTLGDALNLYADSLIIPIVGLIETVSAAKVAATKYKYELDMKQELFALGIANVFGTVFGAYPSMGAFGRTALHMNSGGQTQLTSLISVGVVVATLLFLTKVFYYLPKVILASIVTFAVASLVDLEEVQKLYRFNKLDAGLLLVTFVATLAFGVQPGIILAIVLSLIVILMQTSHPNTYFTGRLPGTTMYADAKLNPEAITTPGVMAFRFDGPLIFANAPYFRVQIYDLMEELEVQAKVHTIIFDFASVTYLDSTGVKYLKEVLRDLNSKSIISLYADVRPGTLKTFKKSGLYGEIGDDHFFLRVHDAMKVATSGTANIHTFSEEPPGFKWNCFRTTDAVNYSQIL